MRRSIRLYYPRARLRPPTATRAWRPGVRRPCVRPRLSGKHNFFTPRDHPGEKRLRAGRSRHDDLRELHDVMESSSRRAAFEPRPHQGGSWPSTTGFTSSSSLWHLRAGAGQGEFEAPSKLPEKKLLHPTPPAAVPITPVAPGVRRGRAKLPTTGSSAEGNRGKQLMPRPSK